MTDGALTAIIIAAIGSGGLGAGLTSLLRARPERGRLIVEAAEGAVVVQSGVITALRDELAAMRAELDATRASEGACEERCDKLELELEELRATLRRHGINGAPSARPPAPPPSAA